MRLLRKVCGVLCVRGGLARRLMRLCRIVGVNLTGAIAIARYGANLRGLKVIILFYSHSLLSYYSTF